MSAGGRWLQAVAVIVLTMLAAWVLVSAALLIYTRGSREPVTRLLEIPEGTNELIAAGENPLAIPVEWSMYADDVLVLHNRDRVAHRFGGWIIGAHETVEVVLQPSLAGSMLCTLHPSGEVSLNIQPRDFDWRQTVFPTLMVGPPVALVILGSRWLVRTLGEDGPVGQPPFANDST